MFGGDGWVRGLRRVKTNMGPFILSGKVLMDFRVLNITEIKFLTFHDALDGTNRTHPHVIRIHARHTVRPYP